MAEACEVQAGEIHGFLKHYEEQFPNMPPDQARYRQLLVFRSAAHLLRTMGTYEDESRKFVAGLLKKHAG